MSNLHERIEKALEKANVSERHTFFQLKNFIIGKEHTNQGKLWQILREVKSRKSSVDSIKNDLESQKENLELKDIQIERLHMMTEGENGEVQFAGLHGDKEFELLSREREINLKKLNREKEIIRQSIEILTEKIRYIEEEAEYLVTAFEKLSEKEQVKAIDDPEAQQEYWNARLTEELNLRLLLNHKPLDLDLVRTILALNDDAPIKKSTIEILQKTQQTLMEDRKKQISQLKEEEKND